MDGFLLIDKPSGWTSHDVVAKARGLLGVKKIGHAGTLDPMATGLLVLGVGRATRLLRFIQEAEKEYVATARFGVATDSLDADGSVLSREPMPVTEDEVFAAMEKWTGEVLQVPPMVSARKVDGRRLYELAREGKEVDRPPRRVMIKELELLELAPSDYPEVTFRTVCGSGTYIRSLADDLARTLGGRAHLTGLRRTRIGPHRVDDASDLAAVSPASDRDLLLSPRTALVDLPEVILHDDLSRAVSNGLALPAAALGSPPSGYVRLVHQGELLAVYSVEAKRARAEVVVA